MKPRKQYPSDISQKQFEKIRPLLEGVRKRTKPRTVDLYEVFNAVLYLLKSGCQWRMIPEGFPKWCTVHSYWAKWSETQYQPPVPPPRLPPSPLAKIVNSF